MNVEIEPRNVDIELQSVEIEIDPQKVKIDICKTPHMQLPSFHAAQSCGDQGPSLCQLDEPRGCWGRRCRCVSLWPARRIRRKAFMPSVGFLWRATNS